MADDGGIVMSESDMAALKEALCAQQALLQKLYNELDAEREASATAASEALSVILRLQGEKAAIKMEAEQYKRLSEEKMYHAEESLAIIEDLIYHKEMEVAALDHQVQAYRCKLLSMGCVDVGPGQIKFSENFLQRSESLAAETSRNAAKSRKASFERDGLISNSNADSDWIPKVVEQQTGQGQGQDVAYQMNSLEKKISNLSHGDIDSYWEQIRRLGVRVKEIAGANYGSETRSLSSVSSQLSGVGSPCDVSNNATRSPSPQISFSCSTPHDSNMLATVKEAEENTCTANNERNVVGSNYPSSPSVHDVFEVPQVDQDSRFSGLIAKLENKTASQGSKSLKRDVVHPDAVEVDYDAKDKKKAAKSTQRKRKICRHSSIAVVDSRLSIAQAQARGSSVPVLNQLNNRTSEIIEVENINTRQQEREEELKLLDKIRGEINSLRQEIRSWKEKKSSPTREEPCSSLSSLQEAMLHFWL